MRVFSYIKSAFGIANAHSIMRFNDKNRRNSCGYWMSPDFDAELLDELASAARILSFNLRFGDRHRPAVYSAGAVVDIAVFRARNVSVRVGALHYLS